MSLDILLTVEEAAARLKISKHTLNRWRVTGEGPPFVKYGPKLVRYTSKSLDVWETKRSRTSTAQYEHPSRKQLRDQPRLSVLSPDDKESPHGAQSS